MAKIKVHGGDFLKGDGQLSFGSLVLRTPAHNVAGEAIPLSRLSLVDIATEANVKRLGGTVGWGAVGAALLGPVGLLAGLLAGGRGKRLPLLLSSKTGESY